MPATPLAHGALDLRSGSKAGWRSAARRLVLLGKSLTTRGWVHFTWLIIRLAIQSVRTKASEPMLWSRERFGRTLAKYSLLSLMSSL